jgi:uncharacterized protein with HEPN domain
MSLEPLEYIRHILSEAEYLLEESRSLSRERFLADATLRRAFVRSLEIIGEAAKRVPDQLRASYPQVEWSLMAKTRDRLIHGYFQTDYEVVWDIVEGDIPAVKTQMDAILAAESDEDIN